MAEFRWRALNALQRQQSGILLADNSEQAEALLLARGLQQIKLQRNWRLPSSVGNVEISEFMQQMAILLQASLPLKLCSIFCNKIAKQKNYCVG